MKKTVFGSLALGGLLAIGNQGLAQLGPGVDPAVQSIIDRQAERAQAQAIERTLQQAEAAQARVAEQAQIQQVETVQNQIVERVESQVERAQAQTVERAQNQVERVQSQVERAQSQVERVQNQTAERAQGRVQDVQERVRQAAQQEGRGTADPARGLLAAAGDEAGGQPPQPPLRQVVADPDGNSVFVEITIEPGIRAVEFEWVMLVNPAERQQLDNEAADLLEFLAGSQPFALTEGELLTFRVPPDLDANDAILQLVPENLRDQIDRNHLYSSQNTREESAGSDGELETLLSLPMTTVCTQPVTLGMIDSAIAVSHPVFAGLQARGGRIIEHSFVEAPLVSAIAHGTAVASLLAGESADHQDGALLRPLLPGVTLYNAAVFHEGEDALQGATVLRVLAALDWLARQQEVRVINMSLTGPANRLLAQAVAGITAGGKVIVAAAGNEGPHGPLRYPAGYDGVVGVTAVARDTSVFRWASQGEQVDYAALGVDVPVAQPEGGIGPESGTSMAAPVVAAFLACGLATGNEPLAVFESLQSRLVDLGVPGPDPVFGNGLLHP